MRGSLSFINDLKSGILVDVLNTVKNDSTLCMEFRNDYLNIYYRGGNLLKILADNDTFSFHFDTKYCKDNNIKSQIDSLNNKINDNDKASVMQWIDYIPDIKNQMDIWFGKHPKGEREVQQLIVRDNNHSSISNCTDYFICDIEYANNDGRFDMIGVKWPSTKDERKHNANLRLVFFEIKFGDNALSGSSGLAAHIKGLNSFLSNKSNLANIKEEMKSIFNIKKDLGLLNVKKELSSMCDEKPEFILILANHDPDKTVLLRELKGIITSTAYSDFTNVAELKIATSCFMGYGLYQECIHPVDNNFFNKFSSVLK